jgi:uncharacterized protein YdiU (UPF0061 family)
VKSSASSFIPSRAHLALGPAFYDEVEPADFPVHLLRFRNQRWAERVGLGDLDAASWEAHFGAFKPLPGSLERPIALRYHGHQFGVYNPELGDGRGFLFAQLALPESGALLDLGTKGSGTTPWSRGGDGRLTLKGGVREVLATEMLEALGVPTSKAFSLFETGEKLRRGDEPSPTRSSVLVRLSHSHVRFGTFQRLARERDAKNIERLMDHAITHGYVALDHDRDRPLAFLRAVVEQTAKTAAAFDVSGFVHGVLNTDNMNITGEAFDYGPYRFVGRYDPAFVAAYFDHAGLYAFGRQAETFRWNLLQLADALRVFAKTAPFGSALEGFGPAYNAERARRFALRLGIRSQGHDEDSMLADLARAFLSKSEVTVDRFFFDWHGGRASERRAVEAAGGAHYRGEAFAAWRRALESYEPACHASLGTPYFQRRDPVTLHYDVIEEVWRAIDRMDDWAPFEALVGRIRELGAASGCSMTP